MTSTKKFKDYCFNKYDNYEHIYCRTCGHSCYFKRNHEGICSWCGTPVYPSKRSEFKAKMKNMLRKEKIKYEQSMLNRCDNESSRDKKDKK